MSAPLLRDEVLDLYFLEARSKVIEVAAFLDRVERAVGEDDFRLGAFRQALQALMDAQPGRAERVLLAFSDPTVEPVENAPGKGAVGASPGTSWGSAKPKKEN